jgi:hypothetical protein
MLIGCVSNEAASTIDRVLKAGIRGIRRRPILARARIVWNPAADR